MYMLMQMFYVTLFLCKISLTGSTFEGMYMLLHLFM